MYSDELKQVIFDEWEEKAYVNQEIDDYGYILRMEDGYLLDIEEILVDGGMEGLGYSTQQTKIQTVTKGITLLNCYISDTRWEIKYKIDEPLYKGFINHATEYLSLIKLEEYNTDNLVEIQKYQKTEYDGETYEFYTDIKKLTIEDFMGISRIEHDNTPTNLVVPEEFSTFTNMFAEEYNRAKENLEDGEGNLITMEEYLKSLATYGEFDNKMDKPVLEFLSSLADATIIIPLIDACLGVDIITGEDLSDYERGMKVVFAAVDVVTLMVGFKASGIVKIAGKESLKFAGKTVAINIASNGVAYVTGRAGEELGLPLPVTLLMSFAAGSITSTKLGTYAFKNSAGVDLLNVDKNVVDDLAEHLDDINGVTYKDVMVDDFINIVNAGKIPDIDLSTPWKTTADDIAYQEWLRKRTFGKYVPPGMTAAEYEKFLKALKKVEETNALNKVDYEEVLKVRNSGVGSKRVSKAESVLGKIDFSKLDSNGVKDLINNINKSILSEEDKIIANIEIYNKAIESGVKVDIQVIASPKFLMS